MNLDKRIKDELGQYLLNPLISYEYSSEAVKVFVKQLFQELIDEVIDNNRFVPIELFEKERQRLKKEQRQRAKELLEKI